MYAVIETGGKQYRVELGSEIEVDRLDVEPGQTIDLDRVLLVADGDQAAVGAPTVDGATVSASVVRQTRGEKLVVFKYKPKARSRVKNGARADLTLLRISEIAWAGRSAAQEGAAAAQERKAAADTAAKAAAKQAAADQALAQKLAAAAPAPEAGQAVAKAPRKARTETTAATPSEDEATPAPDGAVIPADLLSPIAADDEAQITEPVADAADGDATATPDASEVSEASLGLDAEGLARLSGDLRRIEDLDAEAVAKLKDAGVSTMLDLLLRGATKDGRKALAETTGVPAATILTWVNNADLHRIKGVGTQYADLLEAAGVDTVVELATRRPDNLTAKLTTVNEEQSLVERLPTQEQVADWVAQAGSLPRVVRY